MPWSTIIRTCTNIRGQVYEGQALSTWGFLFSLFLPNWLATPTLSATIPFATMPLAIIIDTRDIPPLNNPSQ